MKKVAIILRFCDSPTWGPYCKQTVSCQHSLLPTQIKSLLQEKYLSSYSVLKQKAGVHIQGDGIKEAEKYNKISCN